MDSLTQFVLGAAVGEAVAGKKVGNKAIIWGGVAGTIPDLDIFANFFMDIVAANAFHRTVTHSLLFSILLAPLLGWILTRIYRNKDATFSDWTWLFFLGFTTHILLDCFTTWGTMVFWPFSDYRVAYKSIFVIDPLYTLPLLITVVWVLFVPKLHKKRRDLIAFGLALSSVYLIITLLVKAHINQVFEASFEKQNLEILRYDTRPAPFNIILWTSTAEVKDGYYISYYSLLDKNPFIDFQYFPKNRNLLSDIENNDKVQTLINHSEGRNTVEPATPGYILNDLRFGQMAGLKDGNSSFSFSYQIYLENGDWVVEEIERDIDEAKKMVGSLFQRILGKRD